MNDVLCAQLTRDLIAIVKFFLFPIYFNVTFLKHACIVSFFIRSSSEHVGTLAVTGEIYACKCACMVYFGNANFPEFLH